jgi:hypothetical protein
MTNRLTNEERELLKLVERMPAVEENRLRWIDDINENGLREELAEELRNALSTAESEKDDPLLRRRYLSQLLQIVRRWRLARLTKKR